MLRYTSGKHRAKGHNAYPDVRFFITQSPTKKRTSGLKIRT
jgi:hypothetical protein